MGICLKKKIRLNDADIISAYHPKFQWRSSNFSDAGVYEMSNTHKRVCIFIG